MFVDNLKNAKISPLCLCSQVSAAAVVGGTTTTTTTTTQAREQVCQLNQSPWDLIPLTLPDSCWNYQAAEGDDSSGVTAANGSLGDSTGAPWSVASLKMSMEEGPAIISSSRSQDMMNVDDDEDGNVGNGFESRGRGGGGGVPYRARARGASPWLAYKGDFASSHTHHHLTSSYEHHSSPISESEMEAKAEPEAEAVQVLRRPSRGRPKKPPSAAASANPHEFYYYSGFGPLWGKRRGSGTREIGISNNASAATTEAILVQEEEEEVDFNNNDYVNEEEEDDDDNGDDGMTTGRKRIRKPVKARSLKSLM